MVLKAAKFLFAGISLVLIFTAAAMAQVDEVTINKQKAKATIRPRAKPAAKKVDYSRRVLISRIEKKSRSNYTQPTRRGVKTAPKQAVVKKVEVPLLAVQLRLLTVGEEGKETEVDPLAAFSERDRLRLSLKANQRGYLYVIKQRSPDGDGEIIFPNTLVNSGSNYVEANTEYILPSGCPKDAVPTPRDCALTLTASADAPQEYFTLVFTRDSLIGLPNDLNNSRVKLSNLMDAGRVKASTLVDLIDDSGQDLVSQQGDSPAAVRIINVNPKDNEEIIETFILNKMAAQ
jgi:Domain of unknown function (DUF4384)